MEDETNACVDRISHLPEHVIHHIMSFLRTKDVVCTSILSKTWQSIWASFPIFDFDETSFEEQLQSTKSQEPEIQETRNKFMRFVDETLLRLREQKISMSRFKLLVTLSDFKYAYLINQWIELATENNLKMLDLCIQIKEGNTCYSLPRTTFAANSLTVLRLKGCKLEQPSFSEAIKFVSLQELSLTDVYVDEQIFQKIISSCHRIKDFALKRCSGVKILQLSHLCELEKVEVCQCLKKLIAVESIEVRALSLRTFKYFGRCSLTGRFMPCNIDAVVCKNLKELDLTAAAISDEWLEELISNSTFLKKLILSSCKTLERISISSNHLETLDLIDLPEFMEAKIDTPNLHSFTWSHSKIQPFLSLNASSLQKVTLGLYAYYDFGTLWFLSLREFLGKFSQEKVLTLCIDNINLIFTLEELGERFVHPLYGPTHLNLRVADFLVHNITVKSQFRRDKDLVDGILWSCQPQTLLTILYRYLNNTFVKCLCKKLMARAEDPKCCTSTHIKCWQHYLKDFQIEILAETNDTKTTIIKCDALLQLLPTLALGRKIRFEFNWRYSI